MNEIKVGDRVKCEALGEGIVVCSYPELDLYSVNFYKTPDVRYNMGHNPALVTVSSLKIIKCSE